ncbi:hypothetical protein SLA2020_342860 [Shorea laevis]
MRPNELYASSQFRSTAASWGAWSNRKARDEQYRRRKENEIRQLQFFHFEKNLKDGPQSSSGPVRSIKLRNEVCLQLATVADKFLLLL